MKSIHGLFLSAAVAIALTACNNKSADSSADADSSSVNTDGYTKATYAEITPGKYVNLTTGKEIYVIKNEESGYAIDSIANIPIEFYINPTTHDTLYKTGLVVNNLLVQEDGMWKLDERKVKIDGDEIKIKDGDFKLKVDGEESKVKDGDSKTKVDGDESKVKDGDYKEKVDGEDVKVKDGNYKLKIEDGKVKEKIKD
jgi:hypothetical protein